MIGGPDSASALSSGRWMETPGDRTITSHPRSACGISSPVTTRGREGKAASSCAEGTASKAATSIRAEGRRRASWPARDPISRPAPHTPMRAPSSSENRTDLRQQLGRHVVILGEREHPLGVSLVGTVPRQDLGDEPADDRGARASAGSSASRRIAARLSCSSPTHSNGLWPPRGRQQGEALELALLVEQVAPEDLASDGTGS